jgi:diacylglycerol kinase family enzyme
MPTAILIANPSASQFTGGLFREVVSALSHGYDLSTQWPVSGSETLTVSRAAARRGVDAVFAMGGDGVAHHVANGVVGSQTALGLIPAGTTNVLSRILGIPQNPKKAAEAAVTYRPVPTRVATLSGTSASGPISRVATFSVGVGFDAAVVEAAERKPYAKLRFGGVHYASTALGRLTADWKNRLPNLRVTVGDDSFDAVASLTQVHDPYTYFGRIPLHLTSTPPNGLATLAVDALGFKNSTGLVTRAVTNRGHEDRKGVRVWSEFSEMTIVAEPAAPFQADGELLGSAVSLTVEPNETGLTVLRPEPDQSS